MSRIVQVLRSAPHGARQRRRTGWRIRDSNHLHRSAAWTSNELRAQFLRMFLLRITQRLAHHRPWPQSRNNFSQQNCSRDGVDETPSLRVRGVVRVTSDAPGLFASPRTTRAPRREDVDAHLICRFARPPRITRRLRISIRRSGSRRVSAPCLRASSRERVGPDALNGLHEPSASAAADLLQRDPRRARNLATRNSRSIRPFKHPRLSLRREATAGATGS